MNYYHSCVFSDKKFNLQTLNTHMIDYINNYGKNLIMQ